MPATNAGYMFTNFMKGYIDGSAQANAQRFERARGLMDIAAKQAEIIDSSDNAQARAYAHKILTDVMQQAEKELKPDQGFFGMIKQVMGKKGKKDAGYQDPHELYGFGQYGMQNAQTPMGGGPVTPTGQPQPPGVATATSPQPQGEQQKQPEMISQMMTPEQVAGGVPKDSGAAGGLATPPPEPLPEQGRQTMIPTLLPRDHPVGSVLPDQATGKGAEKVLVGPDQFDYRIDGVQVSPREYRRFVMGMAERNAGIDIHRKELEATSEQNLKNRTAVFEQDVKFNKQKADMLKNSPWYQGEIASGDPARIKAANDAIAQVENPDLKIPNLSYQIEQVVGPADPKTGQRMRKFMVIDRTTGLPTGKEAMPAIPDPPNADEAITLGLLKEGQAKDPNFTYNDAVLARGKMILDDARTAQKVKQLQLSNAGLENQLNQIKLKVAKLNDNPNRQWINGIYEDTMKVLLSAMKESGGEEDATQTAEAVFNGTIQQMARFGISFDEFLKVNGRDPAQLKEVIKQQYLNQKQASERTPGAGRAVTTGIQ
jgi:hypothetical protein